MHSNNSWQHRKVSRHWNEKFQYHDDTTMCRHPCRASCQIHWAVWQVHPSAPREHIKSNSEWQLYGNNDDYGGSSTPRVKLIDSDGCVNCSRWGDGRRARAQEMPECRGKEKPLNRGVQRVSFNFPLFLSGWIDGWEQRGNMYIHCGN